MSEIAKISSLLLFSSFFFQRLLNYKKVKHCNKIHENLLKNVNLRKSLTEFKEECLKYSCELKLRKEKIFRCDIKKRPVPGDEVLSE